MATSKRWKTVGSKNGSTAAVGMAAVVSHRSKKAAYEWVISCRESYQRRPDEYLVDMISVYFSEEPKVWTLYEHVSLKDGVTSVEQERHEERQTALTMLVNASLRRSKALTEPELRAALSALRLPVTIDFKLED